MSRINLITWNIQWGLGCDGKVDLRRIVDSARSIADFDVLCLQEVASNFPDLDGNSEEDQPARLARLLPGYEPLFGAATDVLGKSGSRQLFGNMILSRLPVVQAFRHLLPWPADPEQPSMQRGLVEAVVEAPFGLLRIMTTHLEYYSAIQRTAQVERIREIVAEGAGRARFDRVHDNDVGPFRMRGSTGSTILTADFNFRPDDSLHDRLCAPNADGVPALRDAWQGRHPGVAHPVSVGLYDRKQWPGGYCCDFIYVSEDLYRRLAEVEVDQHTDASDHQPVLLTLDARVS